MGAIGTEENVLTIEEVFELFPRLDERRSNTGLQLSGGEQQMLSIARALLGRTDILLLDEPTEGLAPQIISDVLEAIEEIRDRGVTVLLVAQNLAAARQVASRHYVLHQGQIVFEGDSDALDAADNVREQYLGVSMQTEH
jgi:branched-chain amino acid transport system ATP-binding protein